MTKQVLIVIMFSFLEIEQEAVLIAITLFFFISFWAVPLMNCGFSTPY